MWKHSGLSKEPRPLHLQSDGLVLPPTHAFWRRHFPPIDNGVMAYGCKCRVVGVRSPQQARRLGGDPDKTLPQGWHDGELVMDSKPSSTVAETVRAAGRKTIQWDYRLAKQFMESVPATQRDALATAIRTQPETGEAVRRYARRVLEKIEADVPPYQTMGLLTTAEAAEIARLTKVEAVARELYDWTVDPSAVVHIRGEHGDTKTEARRSPPQRAVVASDYARLPKVLGSTPTYAGLSWETGQPQVEFVKEVNGEKTTAVFEVRQGRRMLALKTLFIGERRSP